MIRTRIAPSPTGPLHIGTARTALFNWLFAQKNRGGFILRLEDTDKARSEKRFEEDIITGLKWLGIDWTEQVRQSDRFGIYEGHAEQLLEQGKAYKEGRAIILKLPKRDSVRFDDIIRGRVEFDTDSMGGDIVLIKSDGTPTYNFAAAVDDAEMNISHVIRGEDHISNTPKQIIVQQALGLKHQQYAHLPLILGPDRSKLSKRHGATSVNEYRAGGYLAEAFVNFMALLGWNPGTEQEIFSREELIKEFSLERVQKGGAIFNIDKLEWVNQQHIRGTSLTVLKNQIKEYISSYVSGVNEENITDEFVAMVQPRMKKLSDINNDAIWFARPDYDVGLLSWKNASRGQTKENLERAKDLLDGLGKTKYTPQKLENELMGLANERGRGEVLWPLRVALSGRDKSPSPFELAALLGKKETIARIKRALEKLS